RRRSWSSGSRPRPAPTSPRSPPRPLRGLDFVHHHAEVELLAGRLREQLVGAQALPFPPQRTQEVARLRSPEPLLAEAVAQDRPQMGLERPCPQVVGDVEA